MTPKHNTKYFFPLVAVAAVALIAVGWLLYASRTNRLREMQAELKDSRAKLADIQQQIRQQDRIAREHSQLEQELSMLEPGVPPYAYIPTFLRQIETVAVATNNTIRGIRPIPQRKVNKPAPAAGSEEGGATPASTPASGGKAKAAKKPDLPYDSVGIEVKLQGTYWSVVNFLERMRRFPKLIAINDMDIRPVSGSGQAYESPQLSVEMQLMAVVMKGDTQWTSAKKN